MSINKQAITSWNKNCRNLQVCELRCYITGKSRDCPAEVVPQWLFSTIVRYPANTRNHCFTLKVPLNNIVYSMLKIEWPLKNRILSRISKVFDFIFLSSNSKSLHSSRTNLTSARLTASPSSPVPPTIHHRSFKVYLNMLNFFYIS